MFDPWEVKKEGLPRDVAKKPRFLGSYLLDFSSRCFQGNLSPNDRLTVRRGSDNLYCRAACRGALTLRSELHFAPSVGQRCGAAGYLSQSKHGSDRTVLRALVISGLKPIPPSG